MHCHVFSRVRTCPSVKSELFILETPIYIYIYIYIYIDTYILVYSISISPFIKIPII